MGEEKLQKDVDDLYERTNNVEKKLIEMEINQKHYTEALEKVAESNLKLVETLQNMEITFTKIDGKINEISRDVVDAKNQIGGIDCRMKKIEDDSNFEIMEFLKKNFPWVVVIIGFAIYQLSGFIKF